ncbi:TPA: hypothetical protein ACNGYJ_005323 [Klebsiella quasipneumoniae subsp. quasipneumoniae]
MTFAMVGVIQWYALSATAGAGSSILSADKAGLPVHRGAKQIHSRRPISLKKNPSPKTKKVKNRAAFSPIFRLTGRAQEGAMIVVMKIQIATANAAKGF